MCAYPVPSPSLVRLLSSRSLSHTPESVLPDDVLESYRPRKPWVTAYTRREVCVDRTGSTFPPPGPGESPLPVVARLFVAFTATGALRAARDGSRSEPEPDAGWMRLGGGSKGSVLVLLSALSLLNHTLSVPT